MAVSILKSLAMAKYGRLLPRMFPGAVRFELRDRRDTLYWCHKSTEPGGKTGDRNADNEVSVNGTETVVWSDFCNGVSRRQTDCGEVQFRSGVTSRSHGDSAWLIAAFDIRQSIPLEMAAESIRRAFGEATAFLREEIELQSECNQLAIELTERYEELNLVYATKDQVEFFEDGQEALVRLVHNCADYLDVGLAALICRDRELIISHANVGDSAMDAEQILDLLSTRVYDRVESQVQSVVLNGSDTSGREELLCGRTENLIAYPIMDDYGAAIGLLAVVAGAGTHTFSNGDRNLLEVMAKKASRIIHTHHDSLTGLLNRNGFESIMVSTLSATRRNNQQHCLIHIDIDQLHVVNDLMGFQEGDNLIRRVGNILKTSVRSSDCVARLGGDEFGALLGSCSVEQGTNVAHKIRDAVANLIVATARRKLNVTVSVGLVAVTGEVTGIVGVMASAEIACRIAKESGGDRIQLFKEDNTALVRRSEEIEWIGRIQDALQEDEFALYCQPVMPLANENDPPHFEVLIRMKSGNGEIVLPGSFLPAAERYQLMPAVDRWVIRNTFTALRAEWSAISADGPVFCVNLSGQSLTSPGFQAFVIDELQRSQLPPENICFEITETAAISNIDEGTAFISALRKFGCRFALDDFGAGLSSFGYLKVLPVDYLKIDGSFVREMASDDVSRSMVNAIYQIGRTMGLATVAEFVEDQEIVEILRTIGVDYVQGFGIGRPVPMTEVLQNLRSGTTAASA